jgi:hypothetical protein
MRNLTKAALILAAFFGATPTFGQTGTCKTGDAFSRKVVASLKLLMGSEHSVERTAIGLPQVDTAHVVLVSDDTVCTSARIAMDSLAHAWNSNAPSPPADSRDIYVVLVGSTYCVFNPYVFSNNNHDFLFYFGSGWQFLAMRAL